MIRSFLKGGVFHKTPKIHENASISENSDIVNKWYVDTKINDSQINTKEYVDGKVDTKINDSQTNIKKYVDGKVDTKINDSQTNIKKYVDGKVDTKINDSQTNIKKYVDGKADYTKTYIDEKFSENGPIPRGAILLWSGAVTSIPAGWALCNGKNGTPNLVDRFVIGSGGSYRVGTTGGSKDAIVVEHTHAGTASTSSGGGTFVADLNMDEDGSPLIGLSSRISIDDLLSMKKASAGAHTHPLSISSTGRSGTNANLPPYYALAYIMKL